MSAYNNLVDLCTHSAVCVKEDLDLCTMHGGDLTVRLFNLITRSISKINSKMHSHVLIKVYHGKEISDLKCVRRKNALINYRLQMRSITFFCLQ